MSACSAPAPPSSADNSSESLISVTMRFRQDASNVQHAGERARQRRRLAVADRRLAAAGARRSSSAASCSPCSSPRTATWWLRRAPTRRSRSGRPRSQADRDAAAGPPHRPEYRFWPTSAVDRPLLARWQAPLPSTTTAAPCAGSPSRGLAAACLRGRGRRAHPGAVGTTQITCCAVCGADLVDRRADARHCSNICRQKPPWQVDLDNRDTRRDGSLHDYITVQEGAHRDA